MLRIWGSPLRLCSGVSRREMLRAGSLAVGGLGLSQLLQSASARAADAATSADRAAHFGRAKRCLLLFLYGSPSQLETFDMKPSAPEEIRGTMKPIPSSLPGLDVCELLPHTARVMDKVTVVRSVTHEYPIHGVAFASTGIPAMDVAMELAPHDQRHHPFCMSAAEYIFRQRGLTEAQQRIPQNLAFPFPFSSQRVGEVSRAGPYAAWLGSSYNPIFTEYHGAATRSVEKTLRDMKVDCWDPYVACNADSHFSLSMTSPQPELTLDRLNRRRSLLGQFESQRRLADETATTRNLSRYQEMAFSLLSSAAVSQALDVRNEPVETRELYGMTLFGQSCLAARRMLEAGTRLATVFWDEYGLAGDAWDTHWNHYPRMTDQLLPPFDRAFSGLITDLDRRGMLDDTLVVLLSEHGRTPKLNNAAGGGRDHWSRVYSVVFAGAGIARGRVVGSSDASAAEPASRPVSPKDLLATMYHLLGIDPHTTTPDLGGRPVTLVPETADVVPEMLA